MSPSIFVWQKTDSTVAQSVMRCLVVTCFIQEFWFDWKYVNWYVKIQLKQNKNGQITLIYRP